MCRLTKSFFLFALLVGFSSNLKAQISIDTLTSIETPALELDEKAFHNLAAKGTPGGVELKWSLDYKTLPKVKNQIIRYKRKLDKKKPWKYSEVISSDATKLSIEGLRDSDKYIWSVGLRTDGGNISEILTDNELDETKMVWAKESKFETDEPWGLKKFLILLGSLGLFIFGMKMMSEGLQQSAGSKMRQILGGMTSNRYIGVVSGFLITALVQSSSATTVMTVSFVNAGLLSLVESAGIMMGANIGTTITGWLVSYFGFKVSISDYALVIIAMAAPMMFFKAPKFKGWSSALIGFAILFMGLNFLKESVPSVGADSGLIQFFTQFSEYGIWGRVAFVMLGTLVTIVIQSSSAAMALTLTLVISKVIPFEVGAAMILGENIGTTITAELASLVGNVHAKRSARIHSIFNLIGVTWMIFLMPFFLNAIANFMPGDSFHDPEAATLALAAFHTVFNVSNVLLTIGFVPWLVRAAEWTVPSKGDDDEVFKLEYISSGIMHTPELAILEAKKEVHKFGKLTLKMSVKTKELLNSTDIKEQQRLIKKISKYEDITDRMETEIASYLTKVSADDLSGETSNDLRAMLSIINDLERIGDIYFEISKAIERKNEQKLWFHQKQRDHLNQLFVIADEALEIMIANLQKESDQIDVRTAVNKEHELNQYRNKVRKAHLKSVELGEYNIKAGLVYSNLFASLERVGDHVINVTEALTEKD